MNKKIILKNKNFARMFSSLVVLVLLVFSSISTFAQIQVRLNLTPDREYNGSQYGGLKWKNNTAKLVNATTGEEISVALCDVTLFDPALVPARFTDKNAGKNKTCEISDLSQFSLATLTDPVGYQLVPITSYTPVAYSKLSYDPATTKMVSTNAEITHAYLTATYSVPTLLTKVYDGNSILDGSAIEKSSIALSGYVAGESGCYVSEITNVYAPSANAGMYNTVGNQATVNGIKIDGSFGVAFNYKINEFKVNARILPKAVSVNEDAINILDHQYDGTNVATIDWATTTTDPSLLFTGVISGDVIDLDRTIGSAVFSDATVADMKNVSISGLALNNIGTFPTDNYILNPTTALSHGNITKANLDPTLTLTAAPVVYGTKLVDIVGTTITPAPVGFDYRIEWLYDDIDSNNYQPLVSETGSPLIKVRLTKLESTFPSNDDANYYPIIVPANITVTPKNIVVDLIGADDKIYDGTISTNVNTTNVTYNTFADLSDVTITRNGILDDLAIDFSPLTASFSDVNVGSAKIVTLSGSPLESGLSLPNYNITYNSATTANITQAPFITMKLKDAVTFADINYPTNFTSVPTFADFDFTGFIGTDETAFGVNFMPAESFTYELMQGGLIVSPATPQPGTYDVVVNKSGVTLADNDILTLLDVTNQSIISNYEGIKFITSDRTQIVNSTPVTIIFPSQDITEYGWTLKEIFNSTSLTGEQIIDAAANADPLQIHATSTSGFINGTFKWVSPNIIPNVAVAPGESVDYIFLPDVSYAGAYGDTIFGTYHVLLNKADLAITIAPTTSTIFVGQTVGDALITSPSGELIHKNKLSVVYNSTTNPTIGEWSYLNPAEVMTVAGPYSKDIQFTLTDVDFLRNYNSPVLLTNTAVQAQASVSVSPAVDNVNPDGVRFEFVYGTKVSTAEASPIIDPSVFILPGKTGAAPGTFAFVTDGTTLTPMDPNAIPYRSYSEDTTLWVVYTPADASYAPEAFLAKVKVTPKTLTYDVSFTKVYDGIANIRIKTTNADLIPAGQIIDRAGIFDDVTLDSVIFDIDSKNVGIYDQTNILPTTVLGQLIGVDAHNYELALMPTLANINITPASLSVNVVNETISIREVLPSFNITWTGFVNNEDFSTAITDNGQPLFVDYGLTQVGTGDLAPTVSAEWIQIPAAKFTANNGNYIISYPSYLSPVVGNELTDVLTVSPAQIKIFAQDRQRVYGEITDPPYFFDLVQEIENPLYYDFDVYEFRGPNDSILIDETEKQSMFLQTPTMSCDSNQYRLQVGTYIINIASNSQLRSDLYGNDVYEIINHVNGVLTVNKATPRINSLPTVHATTYGAKLSDMTFIGGSSVHPYLASALSTAGHFEWDVNPSTIPTEGQTTFPVKFVVDDSHNYNDAIINNQYNDSINGYYNWTPVANDPLSGANFEVNVTINKVQPVIIWPTASLLNYGQTLADANLNNGSTYNPVDVNPTFTWTLASPSTEYPVAGMTMYEVLYTPSNSNYLGLATEIPVYTNKTTPTLSGAAVVANYSYGQTLSANAITATFINSFNNDVVNGTIDWVNGTLTPVDGMTYSARFTPTDAANYNTKLITIQVQVDQVIPNITSWPNVSSLVYGQKIEDAVISGGLAVNPNNVSTAINGTFEWVAPTTLAVTGNSAYSMQFTPADASKYLPVIGNVNIYTEKATPVVEVAPLSSSTYGYTLSQRTLTVNSANNNVTHINGNEVISVAGTIDWNSPSTIPTVNQDTYLATFTPTQTADYNSVVIPINVITTQSSPVMNAYTVANYVSGQKLNANSINLSAVPAYNSINNATVNGTISWNSPDIAPINGNSYLATFIPTDNINYTSVVESIPVVVNQATPVVTWPTVSNLTYGQIINDVVLIGGSAVNPNDSRISVAGSFVWQTPNALPVAGTASYVLNFIPSDPSMLSTSTTIQITTEKATPVVTLNPVSTDTYGYTLANRPLTYNSAVNVVNHLSSVENISVTGTIAWNNSAIIPTVANNEYKATFTPTDVLNYKTVVIDVNVPTTKATPIVMATVAPYSYGQALPINTPTLTSAINPVNNTLALAGGQIVWNSIDELPETGTYNATYYPLDMDNYNTAQVSISVTVNPSTPLVTWPSVSNLVYGQNLVDADLTNGYAKNVNNEGIEVPGQFVWVTPTTVPVAGSTPNVLQFIPSNSAQYSTVTNNNVSVYTAKATPVVNLNPVSTETYGKTLANRPLTFNTANNVVSHRSSQETLTVAGTIAWNNTTTIPTVTNTNYLATFTPNDIANYNTVEVNVEVPTSKATPIINGAAVAAYSYGQELPANTITVTSVVNPNDPTLVLTGGTINWNSIDVLPTTGTSAKTATYLPSVENSANYNSVEFNVSVTVNKAIPNVTWPTTTDITYGQTLADVSLTGSPFAVNNNNNADVPGVFVWESATNVIPANPATSYKLRFIPSDLVNYYADSTMIDIVVNKANPNVNWGDFSTITYGESLSDVVIANQSAVNPITGLSVDGSFAWTNSTIEPNVNNSGFVRTFVPSDLNNYLSVESQQLPVVVNKANPVLTQTTNPFVITYGQVLPTIAATAVNPNNNSSVNGNFEWNYPETHQPQAGVAAPYEVKFIPTGIDAENYNIVNKAFNVQVNKAKPVLVSPTASSLIYEQTLSESLLTGGSAMNVNNNDAVAGTFSWTLPTTIPDAGNSSYPVIFIPQDKNNYENSDPINVVVEVAKKHLDIEIYNLEHIFDGNQKEASFRDAEGKVNLSGLIDAKYYNGTTNVLVNTLAPIEEGAYRVIATIIPTANYEGSDTAILIINKDVSSMKDPVEEVEIVNAIVPGMNTYFKVRDYEQMQPIKIRMVNSNGNQVYMSDNYKNNFDMSHLPNGTYFYSISFTINGKEYQKVGKVEVLGK